MVVPVTVPLGASSTTLGDTLLTSFPFASFLFVSFSLAFLRSLETIAPLSSVRSPSRTGVSSGLPCRVPFSAISLDKHRGRCPAESRTRGARRPGPTSGVSAPGYNLHPLLLSPCRRPVAAPAPPLDEWTARQIGRDPCYCHDETLRMILCYGTCLGSESNAGGPERFSEFLRNRQRSSEIGDR